MPCRSDYDGPSAAESAHLKASTLFRYVCQALGGEPPEWTQATFYKYKNTQDLPGALCDFLREMSPIRRDRLMYSNARDRRQRELATWWEAHLAKDEERERKKREVEQRKQAAQRGLDKLTQAERIALFL